MAEQHTVLTEPAQGRSYTSQYGLMVVWHLELDGVGQVELHKKQGNAPPPQGTAILVDSVAQGEYGGEVFKRIKLAQQNNSGGGGGGGGRGGYDDPKTVARISRSHSQEMALRLIDAAGDADELDLSNREVVGTYLNAVVRPLVDWFDADKAAAGERA